MKRLSRADFAAVQCPTKVVNIPVLGGDVLVRGMTGVERDAYESSMFTGKGKSRDINMRNVRAKLVVACACDLETGERLFTDADIDFVGAMPAKVLDPIFTAAQQLSAISEEDLETLGKSTEAPATAQTVIPGGASSSPSPEN